MLAQSRESRYLRAAAHCPCSPKVRGRPLPSEARGRAHLSPFDDGDSLPTSPVRTPLRRADGTNVNCARNPPLGIDRSAPHMPRHAGFLFIRALFVERRSGSRSYLVHCEATLRPSETYRTGILEVEGGHDTASEHRSLWIDRVPDHTSVGGWPILRHTSRFAGRRRSRALRRRRDPGKALGRRGIDRLLHYSRRGACDPRGRHLGPCAILLRFSCTIVRVEHPTWRRSGALSSLRYTSEGLVGCSKEVVTERPTGHKQEQSRGLNATEFLRRVPMLR